MALRAAQPVQDEATVDEGRAVLAAALRYAAEGIHVFPARVRPTADGKKDYRPISAWPSAATTAEATIRGWFGTGGTWAGALLCAATDASGLDVIDADGASGLTQWRALLNEHGAPETWRSRTPGGGEHWLYRAVPDDQIRTDAKVIAPAVDTRGSVNGFVVLPPSQDYRGSYTWLEGEPEWSELPKLPRSVVRAARRSDRVTAPSPAEWSDDVRPITADEGREQYRTRLADATQGGDHWRQRGLYLSALDGWRLFHLGHLTADEFRDDLQAISRRVWGAPLDSRDLVIIGEAEEKATRSPWTLTGGRKLQPAAPFSPDADTAGAVVTSWTPVDLGPYLRGEVERPTPSVGLARADGLRFLYPGREHTVIGEMESGKSWFALACVAAELADGNPVVYVHFEEADPSDTVERLLTLQISPDRIGAGLRFVGPESPITPGVVAELTAVPPTLVVLDGVNEGMALHGQDIMAPDGAAAFRRALVKPFTRVGAAVLGCDHVVKDREKRERGPMGSIHKGNGLSGSLIMLENAEPFGRGARGASHVIITKDRPGHLRRNGRPAKGVPGRTYMGHLVVDDTGPHGLTLAVYAPTDDEQPAAVTDGRSESDEAVWTAVGAIVAKSGESATTNAVQAVVPMRDALVRQSLERLVLDGRLSREDGGRGSKRYRQATTSTAQDHQLTEAG